ncbi:MAG: FAD synthase [Candidatus Pacebacteria bacterium]|nr:FAD synthase [Candidatus Paceibacterota bacterium]
MIESKTTGILFGTFDILHKGHLNLFKQAREKCNYLIVVIARDETVRKVKNRYPVNSEKRRKEAVKSSLLADKVILGSLKNKFAAIKRYNPDIIFLGYDQIAFTYKLKEELRKMDIDPKIIRLKSFKPEKYKTSLILSNNKKMDFDL